MNRSVTIWASTHVAFTFSGLNLMAVLASSSAPLISCNLGYRSDARSA